MNFLRNLFLFPKKKREELKKNVSFFLEGFVEASDLPCFSIRPCMRIVRLCRTASRLRRITTHIAWFEQAFEQRNIWILLQSVVTCGRLRTVQYSFPALHFVRRIESLLNFNNFVVKRANYINCSEANLYRYHHLQAMCHCERETLLAEILRWYPVPGPVRFSRILKVPSHHRLIRKLARAKWGKKLSRQRSKIFSIDQHCWFPWALNVTHFWSSEFIMSVSRFKTPLFPTQIFNLKN